MKNKTQTCSELMGNSICFPAEFQVLVLAFKALNCLGPGCPKDHLLQYCLALQLRSASPALVSLPLPAELRQVPTRDKAFSVVAPWLWSSLPLEACLVPILVSFKCQAKTHVFTLAFNWRFYFTSFLNSLHLFCG